MVDSQQTQAYEDEINIWELLVILAKRKKIIIVVTLSFFIFSVIYSLLATPQYKVSAVLTAKEEQSLSINKGSIGNIANMLGANVSGLLSSGSLQTIKQTLNSSDFIFYLNEKYKIIDVLFKKKKNLIKKEKL